MKYTVAHRDIDMPHLFTCSSAIFFNKLNFLMLLNVSRMPLQSFWLVGKPDL